MIIKAIFIAAAALSVQAVAQLPAQQAAAPAATQPAKASADDKIVCEREEQIGSRLGARKVCMTVRQWSEQRRLERQDLEKVQQVVNQNPSH
jgi:invasion protein IalB